MPNKTFLTTNTQATIYLTRKSQANLGIGLYIHLLTTQIIITRPPVFFKAFTIHLIQESK